MPFLWKRIQKLLTSQQSPSPKHRGLSVFRGSIERASLLLLRVPKMAASMTVEAAIVLPLFLFFFVNLSCAMEMLRLHGTMQIALWDVGNRMCVYGYALEHAEQIREGAEKEADDAWWKELADVALSYTYIKQEVVSYAGGKYLEQSPLVGGSGGLRFSGSGLFQTSSEKTGQAAKSGQTDGSGDILDIVMTYQVEPWIKIPAVSPFWLVNRYYGHLWTGYDIVAGGQEQNISEEVVYITDNASVYHESLECTHLKLSIREVTLEEALKSRNEYGGRYWKCSKCGNRDFNGTVFIGKDGDYYHYDRGCSGLKRTIHTMARQEAIAKYRPCSRCGASR